MVGRVAAFVVPAAVALGAACASKGASSDAPAGGASEAGATWLADAGKACASNADCAAAEACRTVRLGEATAKLCLLREPAAAASLDGSFAFDASRASFDAAIDAPGWDAADPSICSRELTVQITSSGPSPSCSFNTFVVETSPALLTYPCQGGDAYVTFGPQSFRGTVSGSTVNVSNVETFGFVSLGTSCSLLSTQNITGDLGGGALRFDYSEALVPGQSAACELGLTLCSESGAVWVR